jgi:DNA-binding NarL/FixJ family response regulator
MKNGLVMRVLVVEDQEQWSSAISKRLIDSGHEVVRLNNAEDVDLTRIDLFDSAVFDINFGAGKLTGLDLTRKVRTVNVLLKIIIWSAHDQEALISDAYKVGCDAFVLKKSGPEVVLKYLLAATDGDYQALTDLHSSYFNRGTGERAVPEKELTDRESSILTLLDETDDLNKISKQSGLHVRIIRLTIKSLRGLNLFSDTQSRNAETVLQKC